MRWGGEGGGLLRKAELDFLIFTLQIKSESVYMISQMLYISQDIQTEWWLPQVFLLEHEQSWPINPVLVTQLLGIPAQSQPCQPAPHISCTPLQDRAGGRPGGQAGGGHVGRDGA